jgi:hypothetical protein
MTLTDEVRNETQRGVVLRILLEWQMEWVPYPDLRGQFHGVTGEWLPEETMKFHVNYLAENGYAEKRLLRAGLANFEMTVVRATPKAVDLAEKRLAPDPGIAL